jgi:hypothetical protein
MLHVGANSTNVGGQVNDLVWRKFLEHFAYDGRISQIVVSAAWNEYLRASALGKLRHHTSAQEATAACNDYLLVLPVSQNAVP